MFKHDCKKHGHRYEARFDSVFPTHLELEGSSPAIVEALKTKTYVHDICTRCGDIKRRQS